MNREKGRKKTKTGSVEQNMTQEERTLQNKTGNERTKNLTMTLPSHPNTVKTAQKENQDGGRRYANLRFQNSSPQSSE